MSEREDTLPDDLFEPADDGVESEPQHEDDGFRGDEHIGLTPPG